MITFADLFAGIGGFHLSFTPEAKCVLACELDHYARKVYEHNFFKAGTALPEDFFCRDIRLIDCSKIPDFDVLCAGFPCQPFSQAGKKRGFLDEKNDRGNMFFEIMRIMKEKRPAAFFLENVRGLLEHDNGATFAVMKNSIYQAGYSLHYKIIKASDHGLPQNRPRLFMVGFRDKRDFSFPEPEPLKFTMSDVFGGRCDKKIGYTLRVGGRASGLYDRRNWDAYLVDGKERRLTPEEAKKMQGFPESFDLLFSEAQQFKLIGNSIAVTAARATAKQIIESLKTK